MKMKAIEYVRILNDYYQGYGFSPYKWSVFQTIGVRNSSLTQKGGELPPDQAPPARSRN